MNVRGGFVEPIGKRHAERDACESLEEVIGLGIVVGGVDAIQEQRVDIATLHVIDEPHHVAVVGLVLQRRAGDVDRVAGVPQKMVQRRDDRLNGNVLDAANDERLASLPSQAIRKRVDDGRFNGEPRIVRDR